MGLLRWTFKASLLMVKTFISRYLHMYIRPSTMGYSVHYKLWTKLWMGIYTCQKTTGYSVHYKLWTPFVNGSQLVYIINTHTLYVWVSVPSEISGTESHITMLLLPARRAFSMICKNCLMSLYSNTKWWTLCLPFSAIWMYDIWNHTHHLQYRIH